MQRIAIISVIIIGVLLWLVNSENPVVFPDANAVKIETAYQVSIPSMQILSVTVVTVYDHGKPVYATNIMYIDKLYVGDEVI